VYSEAIRTPDLFETKADWQYTAINVKPNVLGSSLKIPLHGVATGDLREENIRSREIGYYGLWLNRSLQVDLKWFWDDLNDLSSGALTIDSFDPANTGSLKQQGFETEIDYRVNAYLRLRSTYALIHSYTPETYLTSYRDTTFTPEHAATASAIIDWPAGWQLATNYYFANELNARKYSRIDTRLQKALAIPGGELRIAGTLLHDLSGQGDLFADNLYNSPNRLLFSLDLIF
jgi:iron complex outermembrane receptor protein